MSQLGAVQIEIAVLLGRSKMPIQQFLRMGRGAVIPLDSGEDDQVWILANNHPIARGGAVSVFCYGHSGTRKTHSMLGCQGEPGIFARTAQYLLDEIDAINAASAAEGATSAADDDRLSLRVPLVVRL